MEKNFLKHQSNNEKNKIRSLNFPHRERGLKKQEGWKMEKKKMRQRITRISQQRVFSFAYTAASEP